VEANRRISPNLPSSFWYSVSSRHIALGSGSILLFHSLYDSEPSRRQRSFGSYFPRLPGSESTTFDPELALFFLTGLKLSRLLRHRCKYPFVTKSPTPRVLFFC